MGRATASKAPVQGEIIEWGTHAQLVAQKQEAYLTLMDALTGRTGKIPAEYLAGHLLAATDGADWPITRAAGEALIRRFRFAGRDELRIAERPARGEVFGIYTTRRSGSQMRPYSTALYRLEPLTGSCACPDFVRNSLGLCKHMLAVLEDLFARPRKLERARSTGNGSLGPQGEGLVWDPLRPLEGRGDWLERVTMITGDVASAGSPSSAQQSARKWFVTDNPRTGSRRAKGGNGSSTSARSGQRLPECGRLVLARSFPDDPARRLKLVRDLLACIRPRSRGRNGASAGGDPAVVTLLSEEQARLKHVVPGRTEAKKRAEAMRSLKLRLYRYQKQGVDQFLDAGSLLLADDMGLGKTAQAIAACHVLWKTGRAQRGLVIVPAPLKPQWLREWQRFTSVPAAVVDGSPETRMAMYAKTRRGFLIVNYEQVLRDLDVMLEWKPDLVILDEAQRIKNWATRTSACIKAFNPPYRLVLTGTPMENRLDELASLFDWVDSFALEPKWRLAPAHSTFADGDREIIGARNLDTLRERMAGRMLRRRRTEVLSQLPPRSDTVVPVELTPEQRDAHDELIAPIASLLHAARRRPLTQAQFLRLMSMLTTQRIAANGMGQLRFAEVWPDVSRMKRATPSMLVSLAMPKLGELRRILSELVLEQGRKVVVFSEWRRMLLLAEWAVRDVLAPHGVHTAFFTGKESQRRRTQNIVDFHDDPDLRVLFASDAGGLGLNLQRAASACVNLELPWNPAVLEQRIGRIHRLGQDRPIDVYDLVSSGCIESYISGLLADKRELFGGLFDGTSNEVTFERSGSFLDTIRRIIDPQDLPQGAQGPVEADDSEAAAEAEIDRLVASADERTDAVTAEPEDDRASVEARVRSDGNGAVSGDGGPHELPEAAEIQRLFSRVAVRQTAAGTVQLEAPAPEAESLAALLEGMAKLLRGAASG